MKEMLLKISALFTFRAANIGAGLASNLGWHQPKVPEKLMKK